MIFKPFSFWKPTAAAVSYLSHAEVYNTTTDGDTISSGSYTPHESAAGVLLAIWARTGSANEITSYTVTINGEAPDDIAFLTDSASTDFHVWLARWDGAPSGTVSIAAQPGTASNWNCIAAVGISLDQAVTFGTPTTRSDDQSTATSTGDQSITSTQDNSLAIFLAAVGLNPGTITVDGTDTFTLAYEGNNTGGTTADLAPRFGYKAMPTASVAHTLQLNWTNSQEWCSGLVEVKAA